jgi:hypothetical protein
VSDYRNVSPPTFYPQLVKNYNSNTNTNPINTTITDTSGSYSFLRSPVTGNVQNVNIFLTTNVFTLINGTGMSLPATSFLIASVSNNTNLQLSFDSTNGVTAYDNLDNKSWFIDPRLTNVVVYFKNVFNTAVKDESIVTTSNVYTTNIIIPEINTYKPTSTLYVGGSITSAMNIMKTTLNLQTIYNALITKGVTSATLTLTQTSNKTILTDEGDVQIINNSGGAISLPAVVRGGSRTVSLNDKGVYYNNITNSTINIPQSYNIVATNNAGLPLATPVSKNITVT